MSAKTIYFYKLSLFETETKHEIYIDRLKEFIGDIITNNAKNKSIDVSEIMGEIMFMDILDDRDDYIFMRLSKKRRNNSIQKRNYATNNTSPVLTPSEAVNNGIEIFTYCIIGYKHGIMSIARTQGAPDEKFIKRLFTKYKRKYYVETVSVPNNQLINELYDNDDAEINRIEIEIPTPNVQILETIFGARDDELMSSVQRKTNTIMFEIKPEKRGFILDNKSYVKRLINMLITNKKYYKRAIINAKPGKKKRQRRYDLYEKYFKYPIEVKDTYVENGRTVEYPKEKIQNDYLSEMKSIYTEYKEYILAISNRI